MQSQTITALSALLLTATLLSTPNAEARPPRAREAVAVIQTINYDKRTLSLDYPQGRGPRELVWNSDTKFLHDWKFVPATELKDGTRATVYHRLPFFGKPFVTQVVWTNGRPLQSNERQSK